MNTARIFSPARSFLLLTLSILILTACTGVNVSSDKVTAPELFTELSENATFLLKQADSASVVESTDWELAAIQALIKEKQFLLAESVIEHLQKKNISEQQKNDLLLLIASNQHAQNALDQSLQSLQQVDVSLLSESGLLFYLKLKVDIEARNKDHQAASDTLLQLTQLLTIDEEIQQYNDMLLTQLIALPAEILNQFQVEPVSQALEQPLQTDQAPLNSDDKFAAELARIEAEFDAEQDTQPPALQLSEEDIFIQGWYALASLYQKYQLRTNQLLQALDAWELAYPTHPVLKHMPTQLRNIPEATPYQPTKIAVLLPLSGRFKAQGEALQYGISHAYFRQQAKHNQLVVEQQQTIENSMTSETNSAFTESNTAPISTFPQTNNDIDKLEITNNHTSIDTQQVLVNPEQTPYLQFFDTNKMTMQEIADQLQQQDIEFVIGPLLKPNLAAFLPLVKNMPVLALNGFPTEQQDDQEAPFEASAIHYAFPLSPENEAKQAAEIIFQGQHKKPMLMVPNSKFGRRVAKAFEQQWASLNQQQQAEGETDIQHYPAETHYFTSKAQLARFVDNAMQTNISKQRIYQMQAIVKQPLETEVRSRRDVDAIYIVSNRGELILLKPFIAVATSQFAETIPLYASSRSHADDNTQTQNKELSNLTFSDIALLMSSDKQIKQEIEKALPKQRMSTLRLFALGFDSYNLIEQLKQLQVVEGYRFQGLVGELSLEENNTIKSTLQWGEYQRGSLVEVTTPATSQ